MDYCLARAGPLPQRAYCPRPRATSSSLESRELRLSFGLPSVQRSTLMDSGSPAGTADASNRSLARDRRFGASLLRLRWRGPLPALAAPGGCPGRRGISAGAGMTRHREAAPHPSAKQVRKRSPSRHSPRDADQRRRGAADSHEERIGRGSEVDAERRRYAWTRSAGLPADCPTPARPWARAVSRAVH